MEEEKNRSAYVKNETDANRQMTYFLAFMATLMLLVFFLYLFKVFALAPMTYIVTVSTLPPLIVLLYCPLFFLKSKRLSYPRYKYFVLSLFIFSIGILNVIMPKHAVLGWAVAITLTAHYYSPRVCRTTYWIVLVAMFFCLSFGVFYGEYDSNLLSGQLNQQNGTISNHLLGWIYPDSPEGRWDYLVDLVRAGDNRFVKIYLNYYFGRALFLTLLFVLINALNKRTEHLLDSEISVNGLFEKSKTELEIAKDIQLNTLPEVFTADKDVEILAELKAAKEVGGDLYDYVNIDEDHVAILIGDVSGKGVPAAMFMMKTITSFRDFATAGKTPSQILRQINASIHKGNKNSMFVTCFLAILDKRSGTLVYANAGHNPPVIGSNGNYRYLRGNTGFLLGCFTDAFSKDEQIVLKPGESIILYTDGITEARNAAGDFFGEERLLNVLNERAYTSTVELHHSIKDAVANFVLDAPQSDDITYLTVKYRGGFYAYNERAFSAVQDEMLNMLDMIKTFGDEHKFPDSFKNQLLIVGDELLSNIIKHGYGGEKGDILLRLLFNEETNEFYLTIIDHAKPFNQLSVENQAITGTEVPTQVGGLGIFIVKQIMTECAYDRVNGRNILVLKKRFESPL